MKSVLISIRPQWCEKIANGEKTIEVRKNRPKLETPFKCYIYQTMRRENNGRTYSDGKVIGEFVCDYVNKIYAPFGDKTGGTCLNAKEIYDYVNRDFCYGWHIFELKIYDMPKKLSEFRIPCKEYDKANPSCRACEYYYYESNESIGFYDECACDGLKHMTRPPQSWCYVEGGEG